LIAEEHTIAGKLLRHCKNITKVKFDISTYFTLEIPM